MKYFKLFAVFFLLSSLFGQEYILAQGFEKGAVVQYKGKDGKIIKGKLIGFRNDPNSGKMLNLNNPLKVQSKDGNYFKYINVLFKDYIKLSGGKNVGNNTCEFTFTRKDNKSFDGRLSCYFFKVVIEDIDGFGENTYRLKDIVPLSVVSSGGKDDNSGNYIICPHCGEKIYIDVHK
ncbi:MAG: hypothetical protein DRI94_12215 [Bacteroidetes bacterium]|nr:MAG: hypothetical protein DRI94_12215 [Bacteroidota bacterium]